MDLIEERISGIDDNVEELGTTRKKLVKIHRKEIFIKRGAPCRDQT